MATGVGGRKREEARQGGGLELHRGEEATPPPPPSVASRFICHLSEQTLAE